MFYRGKKNSISFKNFINIPPVRKVSSIRLIMSFLQMVFFFILPLSDLTANGMVFTPLALLLDVTADAFKLEDFVLFCPTAENKRLC